MDDVLVSGFAAVSFVVFIVAFSAILTIVGYFMGYGLAGLWSRLQNREGRNG